MAPLVNTACELLSRVDVFLRSTGDPSFTASDQLFCILNRIAPAALVDWLERSESGKVPHDFIRKMEKLLITCERCTVISDLQTRLFELAGAELERYCYKEGMRLKPHPEIFAQTLCLAPEAGEPSALHLQMEESMVLGNLDASCALNCVGYADDPVKRMWALFALRFYIRTYIDKLRKAYSNTVRWTENQLFVSRALARQMYDGGSIFGPKSLMPMEKDNISPLMQRYDEFCSGRCSQREDCTGFLNEVVSNFQHLFQEAIEASTRIKEEFSNAWPHQERGARVTNRHIERIVGYGRIAPLSEEPISLHILGKSQALASAIGAFSFHPWIQRMLSGGEKGLVAAIAEAMAPENTALVEKMLREFGLAEDKETLPPSPASSRTSQEEWLSESLRLMPKGVSQKPARSKRKGEPRGAEPPRQPIAKDLGRPPAAPGSWRLRASKSFL